MSELELEFRATLAGLELPAGRGIVAVSGGPDSLVLLDLLVRTREAHGLELVVAHADHGLHAQSADIARRLAGQAAGLGLPFESTRLQLAPGASETQARAARWRWLRELRRRLAPAVLLLAHQRDDQVETVLMRVLRGSGPAGLGGMRPVAGGIVRPLLSVSRQALAEYAVRRGLDPWDDPANRDARHLRSWVRTSLLPALRARLPDVDQKVVALARQAAHDRCAWDAALEALGLDPRVEPGGVSVASGPVRSYDSELAARLVMAAARRAGLVLGPGRAGRVVALAWGDRSGARATIGGGWLAERRFDRIALTRSDRTPAWCISLPDPGEQRETGGWRVRTSRLAPAGGLRRGGWATWVRPGRYEVRSWRPGDRILPLGGRGRRLVVRCMQEAKVGRGERAAWPVVTIDDTVVWVPGVCRSGHEVPLEGTEAWRVDVERI